MLLAGPLLRTVLEHCQALARGQLKPAQRRLFAYAGHDSTVSNLLIALGAWDTQIPSYGILVLVELHEDPATSQYGLKVSGAGQAREEGVVSASRTSEKLF